MKQEFRKNQLKRLCKIIVKSWGTMKFLGNEQGWTIMQFKG